MKLYDKQIKPCHYLRTHPDFASQRPSPVGIAGSGIYRFVGTNVYSWYVNSRPAMWTPYGEPVVLTKCEVVQWRKEKSK